MITLIGQVIDGQDKERYDRLCQRFTGEAEQEFDNFMGDNDRMMVFPSFIMQSVSKKWAEIIRSN